MHVYNKNTCLPGVFWLPWLLACLLSHPTLADSGRIMVLYPEVDPPYSTVFTEMLDGIRQRMGASQVLPCALPVERALPTLKACLEHQSASTVITLGRVALQAYESSGLTLPQIIAKPIITDRIG